MLALQEPFSLLASGLRLFDADQAGVRLANAASGIENDSDKIVIRFRCFAHGFHQRLIGSVAGLTNPVTERQVFCSPLCCRLVL
jgi:hypothetical protein